MLCFGSPVSGMNAAVRAITRMGIYVGAKVYLIYEVFPKSAKCFLLPLLIREETEVQNSIFFLKVRL